MSTARPHAWETAQVAERAYWYPTGGSDLSSRRAVERELQAWYAGLLFIADAKPVTVLEIGAGPQGLLTRYAASARLKIAVEPMRLTFADAELYAARGVERHEMSIERWHELNPDVVADEVWMTNVLQHVERPEAVTVIARMHAARRVRLFEWVNEPVSVVHLHSLNASDIDAAFPHPWHAVHMTDGRATTAHYAQRFAARIYERRDA